jgi:Fe-Mn family superoxide dismutase
MHLGAAALAGHHNIQPRGNHHGTHSAPLPYAIDALAPAYSQETLEFHHGKHHNAYVVNLNNLQKGTEFENMDLEESSRSLRRHLQQRSPDLEPHLLLELHDPQRRAAPTGALADAINKKWGSYAEFKKAFVASAVGNFGSGWTWLVKKADGSVDIVNMGAAGTPDHRRQGAADRGRVGTRLLHRLPQPASQVCRNLPGQAGELEVRRSQLRRLMAR